MAAWWGGLGGDDRMDGDRTGEQRLACWLCPGGGRLLAQTLIWADLLLESLDLWAGRGEAAVRAGSRPLSLKGRPPPPVVPLSPPRGWTSASCHRSLVGPAHPPVSHRCGRGLAIAYAERPTPGTK